MTDRYENIRKALADLDAAAEAHHELAWRDAHVRFVVHANPKTIRELLKERDALEAENERLRAEIERLRAEVVKLRNLRAELRDQEDCNG